MVSLRSLVTGAMALMAVTVNAALTPQQIADGLKQITKQSEDLQSTAQSITIVNAPLIVIGQGPFPVLIKGFTEIANTAAVLGSQLPGTAEIRRRGNGGATIANAKRGPEADLVFDAYRTLDRVLGQLLNILIGKAGILEQVPVVGQPIATVLRAVESHLDTIAISLINLTPARAEDLTNEANQLDATLSLTIQKYNGLDA